MYLSFALKIAFSNFFSLRKMFLELLWPRILIICLVALKQLEVIFVHLSSKMTFFCKKAQTMKICLLHCKKLLISLEFFSCTWALLLNTELVFLEALKKGFSALSSKMTFSAKKLKHMKICLLHCKKLFISLEIKMFHVLELALKIAFTTFSY